MTLSDPPLREMLIDIYGRLLSIVGVVASALVFGILMGVGLSLSESLRRCICAVARNHVADVPRAVPLDRVVVELHHRGHRVRRVFGIHPDSPDLGNRFTSGLKVLSCGYRGTFPGLSCHGAKTVPPAPGEFTGVPAGIRDYRAVN